MSHPWGCGLGQPARWCCVSVVLSVSSITREHVYECQPYMVGMGKGWQSRNDHILVLIQIPMWIYDHFFPFPLTLHRQGFMWYILTRQMAPPQFFQTVQLRSSRQCSSLGGVWALWHVIQCYDTVGWVIWPVKSSPKWPAMCRVGR